MTVDEAVTKVQKEKTFRKPDMLHKFHALVSPEVEALEAFYQTHRKKHVQEVFQEREKLNLATTDLEEDEYFVEEIEKRIEQNFSDKKKEEGAAVSPSEDDKEEKEEKNSEREVPSLTEKCFARISREWPSPPSAVLLVEEVWTMMICIGMD